MANEVASQGAERDMSEGLPELESVTFNVNHLFYVTTGMLDSPRMSRQLHAASLLELVWLLAISPPMQEMCILSFEQQELGTRIDQQRVCSIDRYFVADHPQTVFIVFNLMGGKRFCMPPLPENLPHEKIYTLAHLWADA